MVASMTAGGGGRRPAQVVVLLADGTRPDRIAELAAAGELPGISRWLLEPGGGMGEAVGVFPSTTGPAHLPFLTGQHPGRCNLPGIRWLDPQRYRNPFSLFRFRSYMGLGNFLSGHDLPPGLRTLFHEIPDHASASGNVRRGLRFGRDLTRFAKIVHNVRSFVVQDWFGLDRLAGELMESALCRSTRFVFGVLYAADSNGHKQGPWGERTTEAYRVIDRAVDALGRRIAASGGAERVLLALVSDHGLSATQQHLDLAARVEAIAGPCLAHPTLWRGYFGARSAVMVSGNSMAHVYLRAASGWGPAVAIDEPQGPMAALVDDLLAQEAVDQVVGRARDGALVVRSARGSARLRATPDGRLHYEPGPGDPFGYGPELAGSHSPDELLERTSASDYPDAPGQLLEIFASPRCGHLVVTARPGFDLRARFERPPHLGSHGSLHRDHMMTPFLLNRPLRPGLRRSADLHPTILAGLGLPLPANLYGRNLWAGERLG